MLLVLLSYIVLLVAAPWIAIYYHTPVLTELIRVMGLVLFPGAVISIQTARISRKLQFRKLFQATMIAACVPGIWSLGDGCAADDLLFCPDGEPFFIYTMVSKTAA